MDNFKSTMHSKVGPGGLNCPCCNYYHGKDKNKLNRLARRKGKAETRKLINEVD